MDITDIFELAVQKGASDIIITVGSPPVLRINGELLPTNAGLLGSDDTKRLVYDILDSQQVAEFEAKKEHDFSLLHAFERKWFGVPQTYPPKPLNGVLVASFLTPGRRLGGRTFMTVFRSLWRCNCSSIKSYGLGLAAS